MDATIAQHIRDMIKYRPIPWTLDVDDDRVFRVLDADGELIATTIDYPVAVVLLDLVNGMPEVSNA